MQVELRCPRCSCHLRAAPDTPAKAILERMADEGLWYALGDGETFEDMIFATLTEHGAIYCPECDVPVDIGEESLGQLALQFLGVC